MKKKNILMIVENFFPADSRVRKEADALKQKYSLSVIALSKNMKSEKFTEVLDGIRIYRIPEFPDLSMGKLRYILEYLYFTLFAALIFIFTHPFKRYRVIHVHNPPDILFSIGLLGKIFAAKLVYDHHDLSPELYLTRFGGKKDFIYRGLVTAEKLSCKFANVVISTNESYKNIEISRHGINPEKIFIVRNNPLIEDCWSGAAIRNRSDGNKKKIVFVGAINPQDGLTILLQAMHALVYEFKRKDFICQIVGDGDSRPMLQKMTDDLGIREYVNFTGMIYDRNKIREYLSRADVGVEPAPLNELNMHSTFIKVMEYMAAGTPVVAFDLTETRYSAGAAAVLVNPHNVKGFAAAINELLNDQTLREQLGRAGFERIKNDLQWEKASVHLLNAYKKLSL